MTVKLPSHRPHRKFSNAKRIILECSLIECVHCGTELLLRRPRHMRKTVQTMDGAVFMAGKSKECTNPNCTHFGKHYYATVLAPMLRRMFLILDQQFSRLRKIGGVRGEINEASSSRSRSKLQVHHFYGSSSYP